MGYVVLALSLRLSEGVTLWATESGCGFRTVGADYDYPALPTKSLMLEKVLAKAVVNFIRKNESEMCEALVKHLERAAVQRLKEVPTLEKQEVWIHALTRIKQARDLPSVLMEEASRCSRH